MRDKRRLFAILLPAGLALSAACLIALGACHALRADASAQGRARVPAAGVAPSPSPSPSPLPSPTLSLLPAYEAFVPQTPVPEFVFTPGEGMLAGGAVVSLSGALPIAGTLVSAGPLVSAGALLVSEIAEDPAYPLSWRVTFPEGADVTAYDVADANTQEGVSLASLLSNVTLTPGHYTLFLSAEKRGGDGPLYVSETHFTALGDTWRTLQKSDFFTAYAETLAFFQGEPDRFLYRYQPSYGRYMTADPAWEATYLVDFPAGDGETWRIHRDAVPYFQRATALFDTVRVRVHGTNGDSGVLPLRRLVSGYFGAYTSRRTNGMRYVSHHAFGTAVDLNADMPVNDNTAANKKRIRTEVKDHLLYEGVAALDGVTYYDFTYTGACEALYLGVPETVVNYLLYELAFYRAGFQWGHYFADKSDGMHFMLTGQLAASHDAPGGLRKVYEYAE